MHRDPLGRRLERTGASAVLHVDGRHSAAAGTGEPIADATRLRVGLDVSVTPSTNFREPAGTSARPLRLASAVDLLTPRERVPGSFSSRPAYYEVVTRIVVIDNHGQFTHLERRALRDAGVDTDIVDNDAPPEEIDADGLVLSGGPDIDRVGRCADYLEMDVPVFGVCLGMQAMARELGGSVGSGDYGGYADVTVDILDDDDPLVGSLAPETRVWASHADEVTEVPPGFSRTAESDVCGVEAMSDADADRYGVQWHPEVAHTERGQELFENFIAVCRR